MFKVKLDKTLLKQKQSNQKELSSDSALNQVKLLMESSSAEDMRILNALGKHHNLQRNQEQYGKRLELEKFEKEYDGKIYTIDEIKNLAVDYNLRFLPTNYFCGNLDIEVLAKIKEFSKKTNTEINDACLERKFFILAPENQFALDDEILIRKRDRDPLLFYKIDNTHYKLLHKWGTDFTVFRLLNGFRWKSYWNKLFFDMAIAFFFVSMILATFVTHVFLIMAIAIPVSFIVSALIQFQYVDDWEIERKFFSPKKWDSTTRTKYL